MPIRPPLLPMVGATLLAGFLAFLVFAFACGRLEGGCVVDGNVLASLW